ncbi:MAG TPA: ABC transporter substrate-binding protein [Candidatus Baltobacteraceae bacterium]|nr:ABC transporter substrate-binding protein [Candidatus Baltobacteraceae bacterium]
MKHVLVLLAACALLVTSCAKSEKVPGQRHAWTIPGVLRIGAAEEPDNLNPMFANTAATDEIDAFIFAPLFRYDQHGELFPELATEIPSYANGGISADGKTITLHLRRGVVWADGTSLTARDLRFTWRAVMNDRNPVKSRAGWDDIRTMEIPNAQTVIVRLRRPRANLLSIFAGGGDSAYPPFPEHLLGKTLELGHAAFNSHPLSSGPWILERWNHGASLEFVPNPRYWRGPPKLTHITWRIIPNTTTQLAQLRTHEIDVYPGVSEDQISRLATIPDITTTHRVVANWRHLGFNCARPALNDVRVRRAIAEAVDWNHLNAATYHGVGLRAVSDILPTSWAAPTIPAWRYDVADAQRLIASSGLTHPIHLTIAGATNSSANERAEIQIQHDLARIGVDLEIKNYPPNLLFAEDGPLYGGRYDLEWSIVTNAPDPDNQDSWSGDLIPPHGSNTSFYNDPEITKLSREALETFDRGERKRLYQLEEGRIHDLALVVFFSWEVAYDAYNNDFKNYRPAQYLVNTWNSWEWSI